MTEQKQQRLIKVITANCIKEKHPITREIMYHIKDLAGLADEIQNFYDRENKKAS